MGVSLTPRTPPSGPLPAGPAVPKLDSLTDAERRALLAQLLRERAEGGASAEFALSPSQRRLFFFEQLQPGTALMHIHFALRLAGPLDQESLRRALSEIARRHEPLRTGFRIRPETGEPVQAVARAAAVPLPVVDLRVVPPAGRKAAFDRLYQEHSTRPFDGLAAPLWRTMLVRQDDDVHQLIIVLHHLVADGWSIGVLLDELTSLYSAFAAGRPSPLPAPRARYADIVQRQLQADRTSRAGAHYWAEKLRGCPPVTEVTPDRRRPAVQTHKGARASLTIPADLSAAIRDASRAAGVTPFVTLLSLLHILVSRYTGQQDLVIGSPVAGRTDADAARLIGCFINTVPLRVDLTGDPTVERVLARVRHTVVEALEHQLVPFDTILDCSGVTKDASRPPLFQIYFNMLNLPQPVLAGPGLQVEPDVGWDLDAKFDLTFYAIDRHGEYRLELIYNADLYEERTIDLFLARYARLAREATANVSLRIGELPLGEFAQPTALSPVPPAAGHQPWGRDVLRGSIVDRFRAQVAAHAARPALSSATRTWTYAELDAVSDGVAGAVQRAAADGDRMVALYCRHDAPMIAGMLGVLKAGLAYVPLDAAHPAERLATIVRDAAARILVVDGASRAEATRLFSGTCVIVEVSESADGATPAALPAAAAPDSLAYLLYTSGSTGVPKGVMQSHANVLHFIRVYSNNLGIGPGDRLSLLPTYAFDAAVMDIYAALLNGATLVLRDVRHEGIAGVPEWLEREQVTIYHSTPTLFRHAFGPASPADLSRVRLVVLGGEEVLAKDFERFAAVFPEATWMVNGLGPTESTVTLQAFLPASGQVEAISVPVGLPVEDTEVLLLDESGVPTELQGEIAIRSAHVALGYWNRDELTARAFSPPDDRGRRTYRTGDLGRRLSNGQIEFVGRRDHQVKIRGFRIELGEIETALAAHDGVAEAVVVARPAADGQRQLHAYVVGQPGSAPQPGSLRQHVKGLLPDYMVPATVTVLRAFPLTASGKIDRLALPEPAAPAPAAPRRRDARTPIEDLLASIWADVLGAQTVDIHDDFFELGGHSLLAARLVSKLNDVFWVDLPMRAVFEAPTPSRMSAVILQRMKACRGAGQEEQPGLITINPGGARTPFFFLHAALQGDGFYCYNLARQLGADQPVYALPPLGLDGQPVPSTIEEMAAAQVEIIRRIQPHGPYNLGGFCISGVVALEVGRRLQEAGEQVGIALIVETRAHPPHVFNRLANAIARIAQVFGRLTTEERMELLMRMRPAAYKAWDLYEAGLARTIKRVARRALGLVRPGPAKSQPSFRAEVPSDPTGLAVLDPLRAAVSRANQLAIQAYLPRPFAFPVACFWGTEEPMSQETWRAVVPDLYLEAVPGNHNTCITTQVEALGRAMRTVLDGIHEQRLAAPRTGAAAVQRPSRAARVAVAG